MSTGLAKFADGTERALWTAAETAGALGIVAGYQALDLPDIPVSWLPLAVVLVGALLAGGKAWAAQKWGNGTAATLPAGLEPTPPGPVDGGPAPRRAVTDVDGAPVFSTPDDAQRPLGT